MTISGFFDSEIYSSVSFLVIAIIVNTFAYAKGYYQFSSHVKLPAIIFLRHVIIAFAIYFITSYLGAFLVGAFIAIFNFEMTELKKIILYNSFSSIFTFIALLIFFIKLPLNLQKLIWKYSKQDSIWKDCFMGIISYIIVFPTVGFITNLLELFTSLLFEIKELPQQNAILYITQSFSDPILLIITFIIVIIIVPIVEELLFRGMLQTWLRQKLGYKSAILIASIIFAFFHFSLLQGVSNIVIIGSLFFVSLFLGFIYEKQRSLISPICLHIIFNGVSSLSLFLST